MPQTSSRPNLSYHAVIFKRGIRYFALRDGFTSLTPSKGDANVMRLKNNPYKKNPLPAIKEIIDKGGLIASEDSPESLLALSRHGLKQLIESKYLDRKIAKMPKLLFFKRKPELEYVSAEDFYNERWGGVPDNI